MTDGSIRLLVDAALLENWPGWRGAVDSHVLAPLDVRRRLDGHDVVLPVCTERLRSFLERRAGGDMPLSDGEAVTVAVSIARGLADSHDRTRSVTSGEWWLTDAGRPVLVLGGDENAGVSAATMLTRLRPGEVGSVAVAVSRVAALAEDTRVLVRESDVLEEALFQAADPEPLVTTVFAAVRARALTFDRLVDAADDEAMLEIAHPWWSRMSRHLDADFAELLSTTVSALRTRLRGMRRQSGDAKRSRGRPWLLAACVACAIAAVGLLWPGDASNSAVPGEAPRSPGVISSGAPTAAGEDASADPSTGADLSHDLVAITDALLVARGACASDAACLSGIQEDAGRAIPAGAVDLAPERRSIVVIDEFGGAAVLRVEALDHGTPAQFVVIVRSNDNWLLRDVTGTAEQPA